MINEDNQIFVAVEFRYAAPRVRDVDGGGRGGGEQLLIPNGILEGLALKCWVYVWFVCCPE